MPTLMLAWVVLLALAVLMIHRQNPLAVLIRWLVLLRAVLICVWWIVRQVPGLWCYAWTDALARARRET
jgi:hypothetical protein